MTNADASKAPLNPSLLAGVLLLIGGGLCIGFAPIGLKLSVADGLGPQITAFWRYIFAIPLILGVFVFLRRWPRAPNKWAILAGICFALDVAFWHAGLEYTTVANATFIVNLGNAGIGLLAWIFLKERPSPIWFLAIIIALFGAFMLSTGGAAQEGGAQLKGDALSAVAAALVAGYMLFAKISRHTLDALDVLFWATLTEAVVALGVSLFLMEQVVPPDLAQLRWPLFLAIVVQLVGQGLIIAGVGRVPASVAGVTVLVQPIAASLVAWVLFGETLLPLQLLGAGLIIAGIGLAQIRFRSKTSSE